MLEGDADVELVGSVEVVDSEATGTVPPVSEEPSNPRRKMTPPARTMIKPTVRARIRDWAVLGLLWCLALTGRGV